MCAKTDEFMKIQSSSEHVKNQSSTELVKNQSTNHLAQKLFESMTKSNHSLYSPISIEYVLSLLQLGAIDNTYRQLTNLLGGEPKIEYLLDMVKTFNDECVKMSNAIIVNKNNATVNPEYVELVKKLALIMDRDFSDAKMIADEANAFIQQNTNNLICGMVKPQMLNNQVMMIMINTLYFKSVWASPFKKGNTQPEMFASSPERIVDMMTQTSKFKYFEDSNLQLCNIPYSGGKYCMVFVLPKNSTNLTECMKCLANSPETKSTLVELHVPKFKQQKRIDLIPIMKENGLTDIFCENSKLDKMITPGSLAWAEVTTFITETVVIVDEVGTEAVAATTCVVMSRCLPPKPIVFYANHPFVYGIKYLPTNSLLFVGSYYGLND